MHLGIRCYGTYVAFTRPRRARRSSAWKERVRLTPRPSDVCGSVAAFGGLRGRDTYSGYVRVGLLGKIIRQTSVYGL
jgi:hypothetical protein